MLGEEIEELLDVAPIGFQRLWRIAPLGAQMGEPALDLGASLTVFAPLVPAEAGGPPEGLWLDASAAGISSLARDI